MKMNAKSLAALSLTCLMLVQATGMAAVTCGSENAAEDETTPSADFADNGDGTITHNTTGLVWMRCSLGQSWSGTSCTGTASAITWQQALNTVADVNSGVSDADGDGQPGFAYRTDWRLPQKRELESIVERHCWSPAINAMPFPGTPSSWFWSSSPYDQNPDYAWAVYFRSGASGPGIKTFPSRVRLVR